MFERCIPSAEPTAAVGLVHGASIDAAVSTLRLARLTGRRRRASERRTSGLRERCQASCEASCEAVVRDGGSRSLRQSSIEAQSQRGDRG